jgi:transposase
MMQPPLTAQETEVTAKPKRRRFSAADKFRILKEADECTKAGEQSALLRREGIYSSHLATWRRARESGELDALSPKKRGRKPAAVNPLEKRVSELERALLRAEARAKHAEALVAVQKKVSELLGIQLPTEDEKP